MKCSNCGKEVPFAGKVCPFCNANKQGDQMLHTSFVLGIILGFVVGQGGMGAIGVESSGVKWTVTIAIFVACVVLGIKAKANAEKPK